MVVLYGISNCDTVKKARKFLESRAIDYRFHDFRKDGLSKAQVQTWLQTLGPDVILNKRSRTWKELSPAEQTKAEGAQAATVLSANPTLIKRPVLELLSGKTVSKRLVGFDQKQYLALSS